MITAAFVLGEATCWKILGLIDYYGGSMPGGILLLFTLFTAISSVALALKPRLTPQKRYLLIIAAVFLLGAVRLEMSTYPRDRVSFSATAAGVVESKRVKNGNTTLTLVRVKGIKEAGDVEGEWTGKFRENRMTVSVMSSELEGVLAGDWVRVRGRAAPIEPATNPGEFDFRLYYLGRNVRLNMKAEERDVQVADVRPIPIYYWAGVVSEKAAGAIDLLYDKEDAALMKAILLGDRSELAEETRGNYEDGGISHVLAVSGLHVSLIGMTLYRFLRKRGLTYGYAGIAAGALLIFYGFMTGFGPSVFRAILMMCVAFIAMKLGRTNDLISNAAFSMLISSLISPFIIFNGGFQLSYAAILAVATKKEFDLRRIRAQGKMKMCDGGKVSFWEGLANEFWSGVWILLVTGPVVLYHFYALPLWGLLLNLLVIPLMSYAAGGGLAAVVVELVWEGMAGRFVLLRTLALGLAGVSHSVFWIYGRVVGLALGIWRGKLLWGRPAIWELVVYYGLLAVAYCCLNSRLAKDGSCRKSSLGLAGACVLLALSLLAFKPQIGLKVTYLDVGQGDGILLSINRGPVSLTGRGRFHILIDCGSSSTRHVGRDRLVPFLKYMGVHRIDYAIATHSDADHINGLLWLLGQEDEIEVKNLLLPYQARKDQNYDEIKSLAVGCRCGIRYLGAGDLLQAANLTLKCMSPSKEAGESTAHTEGTDANAQSLVFRGSYGTTELWFMGDAGIEEEKAICERLSRDGIADGKSKKEKPKTVVLKAGHHGSAGSSSTEFLRAIGPDAAILSYGKKNNYGHPSKETLERLEQAGTILWETGKLGAITVHVIKDEVQIGGYLKKRTDSEKESDKKKK